MTTDNTITCVVPETLSDQINHIDGEMALLSKQLENLMASEDWISQGPTPKALNTRARAFGSMAAGKSMRSHGLKGSTTSLKPTGGSAFSRSSITPSFGWMA